MGIQIINLENITEIPKKKSAFASSLTTAQSVQQEDRATLTKVVGMGVAGDGIIDCSNGGDPDINNVPNEAGTVFFTRPEDACKDALGLLHSPPEHEYGIQGYIIKI